MCGVLSPMPTVFTHAIVGLTASQLCMPKELQQDHRGRLIFIGLSVALPIVPDLDGLFLPVIPYVHPLGHRGLTHSIVFALFSGAVATAFMMKQAQALKARWIWLLAYFSIVTASHGLLDAMTRGGLGVAFFAPFDNRRYFFPVRPMVASPIWPRQFVSHYGARALAFEFLSVWTVCCAALVAQRKLVPVALLLGSGVASVVRMVEQRYRLTAVTLLLLAAIVWVMRSI
jgi:inner membrane protein